MKKFMSLIAVLLLSGCYTGQSLFDGPACNAPAKKQEQPQPQPQPCEQPIVQPCAQPVIQPQPCEPVVVAQPVPQKVERLAGVIYFAVGSDYLNETDMAELRRIAQYAKTNNTPVKISGHASHKVGRNVQNQRDIINQDISVKRTQKVADTLAMLGVNPSLISAAAYSDSQPVEVEVDAKTEALNRRVEIYFIY